MAEYTDAQKRAIYKYRKNKYRHVSIEMPRQEFDSLKEAADVVNESVNGFVRKAVGDRVQRVLQNYDETGDVDEQQDE